MDKRDLKIQALREGFRERYAAQADDYENRIADLRIELTEQSNRADANAKELEETLAQLQIYLEKENAVVQEEAPASSPA